MLEQRQISEVSAQPIISQSEQSLPTIHDDLELLGQLAQGTVDSFKSTPADSLGLRAARGIFGAIMVPLTLLYGTQMALEQFTRPVRSSFKRS